VGHFTSNGCPARFGAPRVVINAVFAKEGG
jgi:hypothetical protein